VVAVQLSQVGVLAANYTFALSRWLLWRHSKGMLWLGFSRGGTAKACCGWVLAAAAQQRQAVAGF